MNVVAVIPAKGKSTRLPEKNIRDMLGKPLIAWTIEAAVKSKNINRVIVSTDDEEIARIAKEYEAEVPFIEPKEISATGGNIDKVLLHTADWLQEHEDYKVDALLLLLPTNPLRLPKDLDAMVELFKTTGTDCVSSVCKAVATHNPHWMFMKGPDGTVITATGKLLKDMVLHSQDLPACYVRNDICFVVKPDNLRHAPKLLWGNTMELYEMPESFDADINTEEDWYITEDKLRRLRGATAPDKIGDAL